MDKIKWKVDGGCKFNFFLVGKIVFVLIVILVLFKINITRKDVFYPRDFVVSSFSGDVTIKEGDESWKDLRKNYSLKSGDSIMVREGNADINYWLAGNISLSPSTWLKFDNIDSKVWPERKLIMDLKMGEIFLSVDPIFYSRDPILINIASASIKTYGGDFLISTYEDGSYYVKIYNGKLNIDDNEFFTGDEIGIYSGVDSEISRIDDAFKLKESFKVEKLSKKLKQVIPVHYGSNLYSLKTFWLSFIESVLIGTYREKYMIAQMEELWMESIVISLKGDRDDLRVSLDKSSSNLDMLKNDIFSKNEGYVYREYLKDRLIKLYELSRNFTKSELVSAYLLREIVAIDNGGDFSYLDMMISDEIEEIISWSGTEFEKEMYVVDLISQVKWLFDSYFDEERNQLKERLSFLDEKFGQNYKEFSKILFNSQR